MKLQDLQEAKIDYTMNVEQYKRSPEFKKALETFDYKSSKIQEKNGTLYFITKPEILKLPREYSIRQDGLIREKNKDATIWNKTGFGGILGEDAKEAEQFNLYVKRTNDLIGEYQRWFAKRAANKKDLTNRGLKSLVPLLLPEKTKDGTFQCSHNFLTDLVGAPTEDISTFQCSFNDLVSPLKGAPTEADSFSCFGNKLTTFEGLPKRMIELQISENPIIRISGISKNIEQLEELYLTFIDNVGYLELFKVKSLRKMVFYGRDAGTRVELLNKILYDHLGSTDRDMLDCQEALVAQGMKEFAKL